MLIYDDDRNTRATMAMSGSVRSSGEADYNVTQCARIRGLIVYGDAERDLHLLVQPIRKKTPVFVLWRRVDK